MYDRTRATGGPSGVLKRVRSLFDAVSGEGSSSKHQQNGVSGQVVPTPVTLPAMMSSESNDSTESSPQLWAGGPVPRFRLLPATAMEGLDDWVRGVEEVLGRPVAATPGPAVFGEGRTDCGDGATPNNNSLTPTLREPWGSQGPPSGGSSPFGGLVGMQATAAAPELEDETTAMVVAFARAWKVLRGTTPARLIAPLPHKAPRIKRRVRAFFEVIRRNGWLFAGGETVFENRGCWVSPISTCREVLCRLGVSSLDAVHATVAVDLACATMPDVLRWDGTLVSFSDGGMIQIHASGVVVWAAGTFDTAEGARKFAIKPEAPRAPRAHVFGETPMRMEAVKPREYAPAPLTPAGIPREPPVPAAITIAGSIPPLPEEFDAFGGELLRHGGPRLCVLGNGGARPSADSMLANRVAIVCGAALTPPWCRPMDKRPLLIWAPIDVRKPVEAYHPFVRWLLDYGGAMVSTSGAPIMEGSTGPTEGLPFAFVLSNPTDREVSTLTHATLQGYTIVISTREFPSAFLADPIARCFTVCLPHAAEFETLMFPPGTAKLPQQWFLRSLQTYFDAPCHLGFGGDRTFHGRNRAAMKLRPDLWGTDATPHDLLLELFLEGVVFELGAGCQARLADIDACVHEFAVVRCPWMLTNWSPPTPLGIQRAAFQFYQHFGRNSSDTTPVKSLNSESVTGISCVVDAGLF